MEAEVVAQGLDHLDVLGRRCSQGETGVEAAWRDIFSAPEAGGTEVDMPYGILPRNLQAHLETAAYQYRQLADQHQPIQRDIAQVADWFIGKGVEDVEVVRQLVPFYMAIGIHNGEAL